jgi:hypothetical protein
MTQEKTPESNKSLSELPSCTKAIEIAVEGIEKAKETQREAELSSRFIAKQTDGSKM